VFALEDSNGEIEEAIERITEGRYLSTSPHLSHSARFFTP
jgi:hypothetical protein